ncbi:hypothetical protein GCM10010458_15730 [Microbacterium luteolum]|uniref:FtsX-like permease family protein n=1 Tax=Microbacterium luteolum TaxID=69367 RepID=A0ABY7XQC1_MICLT|nr:hypothetical protein [Microbacterium luteolum]WDM44289.1 hypothetical protein KV395_13980 [Microbacterium luteolum]
MTRSRVPGPFRRLRRQPLRLTAVVLLCATAVAGSAVQSAAAVALGTTISENWRGSYDILVTPPDEEPAVTGDALPPNALAGGSSGLSIADWQRIAAVENVEVAAPIGEILVPALRPSAPAVVLPRAVVQQAIPPQAYRMTLTYATDDGLGERIVERSSIPLVVDGVGDDPPSAEALEECMNGVVGYGWNGTTHDVDRQRYPALVSELCYNPLSSGPAAGTQGGTGEWSRAHAAPGEDVIALALPVAPQPVTRITLVDPTSERALLGDEGAFLEPLLSVADVDQADVEAMQAWAEGPGAEFGAGFNAMLAAELGAATALNDPAAIDDIRRLLRDNGEDLDAQIRAGIAGAGFTPLIVSEAEIAPLTLKIEIEGFGGAERSGDGYVLPAGIDTDGIGAPLGTSVADVSSLLNPFLAGAERVAWPGTSAVADAGVVSWNSLRIQTIGKGAPAVYGSSDGGIVLEPSGYSAALHAYGAFADSLQLGADPARAGTESAYTSPSLFSDASRTEREGSTAIPVGSFDPDALAIDEAAADYVPIGAYGAVDSTIIGGENAGATMRPSVSGLGLVSPRTVAIGSIRSAALWGDESPIASVRVRVGGLDGYTPAAQREVVRVAQQIEEAGFTATIIAGSSPRAVELAVDGYAFGTDDPAQPQSVGRLGTIVQSWSELGAAARVELAVSSTVWAMLGIALAAGLLLLGATQFAAVPARRNVAVVLREIGFTRHRILRWFAAEELPGLLTVAIVSAAAWLLSGFSPLAGVAGGLSVVVLSLTSALAILEASRRGGATPADRRSHRVGARTVAGFGVRQALVHAPTSLVHLFAVIVVGVAAAAVAETMMSGRLHAGQSSLALLSSAQQVLPQAVLGVIGIVGGLLLARVARRVDLERRAEQWSLLRAAGWTGSQIAMAQRVEGVTIGVPALIATGAIAVLASILLGWSSGIVPVLTALVAGAASAMLALAIRIRGGTE